MNYQIVSIRNRDGDTEIHKAGCSHIKRLLPMHRAVTGYVPRTETVTCRRDVCENEYGESAGSFYEESGGTPGDTAGYEEFLRLVESGWLKFAPCTDHIPYNATTKEWLVYIPITIKADSPEQAIERAVADYGGPFALPIDRVELVDDDVEDI